MTTKNYLTFFEEQSLSNLVSAQTSRTQKEKNKIALDVGIYRSNQTDSFMGLGLGDTPHLEHLAGKSILFVNFRPTIEEIEGGHLPLCARCFSKIKKIDIAIVKGKKTEGWLLNDKFEFQKQKKLKSKYDYIVARSSSLRVLSKSVMGSLQIFRSGLITNVKPMSHPDNYKIADRFFSERDLTPPPSNLRVQWIKQKLGETKKRKFIFVPGTLWPVKTQLLFVENLDPTLVKEYTLIFAGIERDEAYKSEIASCLEHKQIRHVFLGEIPREVHDIVAGLSMVTIVSMDARNFRQFEGYPRTLGECIAARSICLVSSFVTPPSWGQSAVISCDFSDAKQLNANLGKAFRLAQIFNWQSLSENLTSDICYASYGISVLKRATEHITLIKK